MSDCVVQTAQKNHFKGLLEQIRRIIVQSACHNEGYRFALMCERDKVGTALTLWRREGDQDFLQYETLECCKDINR
jgi:hypothetical protein